MGSDAYFECFERILELEVLGELKEGEKEKMIAELLEEINGIIEAPIHFQSLEQQEKEDFQLLFSKIVRSIKS